MTTGRWRALADWPLTASALLFLAAYSWEVLGTLDHDEIEFADWILWGTWALFAIDYVVSLTLAEHRRHWFLRHIPDLLVVVLPIFRPLRLLRLVSLIQIFQRAAGSSLRGRLMLYVVSSALMLAYIGALAMLEAERKVDNANIKTFGDAIWWAATTVTTVGYGDKYPVSDEGHYIAIGLMIAGISLIGLITASLASWLVERVAAEDQLQQTATRRQVDELAGEIRELKDLLRGGSPLPQPDGVPAPTADPTENAPTSTLTNRQH